MGGVLPTKLPKSKEENKESEELANLNADIVRLKDSINSTINTNY